MSKIRILSGITAASMVLVPIYIFDPAAFYSLLYVAVLFILVCITLEI